MFPHVTSVTPLKDYQLAIAFDDGESGILDFKKFIGGEFKGVLSDLAKPEVFRKVFVAPEARTVAWSDQLEFDPINLYAHATGKFEILKPYGIEQNG